MTAAFAKIAAALGPVDILVNNAGFSDHPTLARTVAGGLGRLTSTAISTAPTTVPTPCCPAMKAAAAGVIINIGSVNGFSALGDPAYSAGKAGMISLTQSLAHGVRPLRHPRQHRAARARCGRRSGTSARGAIPRS